MMLRRLFLLGLPVAIASPRAGNPVCPYCHSPVCLGYDENEICDQALAESIEIFPTDHLVDLVELNDEDVLFEDEIV